MSASQFRLNGNLYPVLLAETASTVIYHCSIGTYFGHEKCIYTKLCKIYEKYKIKGFSSPRKNLQNIFIYAPLKY